MFNISDRTDEKMWTNDRILVLKKIEGAIVKSSSSAPDPRLFEGKNKLHAIRNDQDGLWYLRYEQGAVRGFLKDNKFTSFPKLLEFVKTYFKERGVEIEEVKNSDA